ncbi:hypothetical protein DAETH_39300 (plasmid) [Deinococcus aetherius]|uniref:Uncharacterized protein n=1 Tax=Deinococcus aetherius TaxID=200252 RepID=A0ABM8AJI5_9DEIO|nr:hypothetical protein [Deinococcus aetherius]BDP43961.1 hypothetical protein DAETH_39300 [Deinococcus aetherius]
MGREHLRLLEAGTVGPHLLLLAAEQPLRARRALAVPRMFCRGLPFSVERLVASVTPPEAGDLVLPFGRAEPHPPPAVHAG